MEPVQDRTVNAVLGLQSVPVHLEEAKANRIPSIQDSRAAPWASSSFLSRTLQGLLDLGDTF